MVYGGVMDTVKEEISVSVSVTRTSYPLPNACLAVWCGGSAWGGWM